MSSIDKEVYELKPVAELPPQVDTLRKNISLELINRMQAANTFESLTACWKQLDSSLGLPTYAAVRDHSLLYCLALTSQCFQGPRYACDGFVKIMDEQAMIPQVEQLGIPVEFLYETVRIGALRSLEVSVAESKHDPIDLIPDGTLSREAREKGKYLPENNIDGFSWANERLRDVKKGRELDQKQLRNIADRRTEVRKEMLLQHISQHMNAKGFVLQSEELELIENELRGNLALWKALGESSLDLRKEITEFLNKHGDEEITPVLFEQFKTMILATTSKWSPHRQEAIKRPAFFNIINPESGWFFICIKGLRSPITLRKFMEAVYCNMSSWGPGNLTIANAPD